MHSVIYEKRFDTGTVAELSEDFTLPDYQPEVRRVLGVRAQAVVDGKYLSGDELEADGSVVYTVCYMDGDGGVAEASETSPFTARVPLKSGDDRYSAADLVLSASAEGAVCRVSGPRRFALSSRVRVAVLSQKPADVALAAEGFDTVRRRVRTVRCACLAEVRGSFGAEGEIREREGMKIAAAQGAVSVTDVRAADGRLTFKGDAEVTVLLAPEDGTGETLTVRGRAPVEESIDLPETPEGMKVRAAVFPTVVMTELETVGDGGIAWKLEYDADAVLLKCGEGEITSDAYSPDFPAELETRECRSVSPAAVQNGRLTVSGRTKMRPGAVFVWAWGTASFDRVSLAGGRAQAVGAAKVTVATRDGEGELSSDEVNLPFRYEWEALADAPGGPREGEDGTLSGRCAVSVSEITAREDGGEWNITAELSVASVLVAEENVRACVALRKVEGEETAAKNVIRVYVPEAGESAWDVEKKFRLPREAAETDGVYII